jgi:hypothetical protein
MEADLGSSLSHCFAALTEALISPCQSCPYYPLAAIAFTRRPLSAGVLGKKQENKVGNRWEMGQEMAGKCLNKKP